MSKASFSYPPEFPNIGEAAYLAGMTRDDFNHHLRPILREKHLEFQVDGKTRFPGLTWSPRPANTMRAVGVPRP